MDSIINAAIEEICVEGPSGVPLSKFWVLLLPYVTSAGLDLCDAVKRAVWARLLALPVLRFEAKGGECLSMRDGSVKSFEESERSGVKVVAEERLRDTFLGIYERKAAGFEISKIQRRVLERIALARTKGVMQHQLVKELKMKGNEIFYYLRGLEFNRLIVRHATLLKTGGKNDKITSVLNTNLIYLHRYARHLNPNSQQRIEITKEDMLEESENVDGVSSGDGRSREQMGMEDVYVKDFLPALEAICNKLEQAEGKILVIKDIKRDLGYRETQGHRAWRNVFNRLKEANLVEEVTVKVLKKRKRVDEKSVLCLHLLKKFDPKDFQPKAISYSYSDPNSVHYRKGQRNEHVELPIEHQIYDIVHSEGVKGITISEVCNKLGLNCKKYYTRIVEMTSRFGMHIEAENCDRTKIYRIWTIENFKQTEISCRSNHLLSHEQSSSSNLQIISCSNELNSEKMDNQQIDFTLLGNTTSHSGVDRGEMPDSNEKSDEANEVMESGGALLEKPLSVSLISQKIPASQRHPCLDLTMITEQRKQRILLRLEKEKFILLADLHRWLESLEPDKPTKMDKKTLLRVLKALEREGQCKSTQVKLPSVGSQCNDHTKLVIFHPSVTNMSNLVGEIYRRARDFDRECRGQLIAQSKQYDIPVERLPTIEGSSRQTSSHRYANAEVMRTNGFIPAKMVRAKLLHSFLWKYVSKSSDLREALVTERGGNELNSPSSSMLKLFALEMALKAMPLDLFLQVVGSTENNNQLIENCQKGLTLSDLAVNKHKNLMNTNAIGRLSSITDILLRLKLLQIVKEDVTEDISISHANLSYAMELSPHVEVPRGHPSSDVGGSIDHRPRVRHDFVFSSKDSVDAYWQTLEYCYAAADPKIASHAFPGSAVPEVFARRSWSVVRVMSSEQRLELWKCVEKIDPKERVSFRDCVKTAGELNLTLSQVLRAFYDKKNKSGKLFCDHLKEKLQESHVGKYNSEVIAKKRKKSSEYDAQVCLQIKDLDTPEMQSFFVLDGRNVRNRIDFLNTETSDTCTNGKTELDDNDNERETHTLIRQCTTIKPKRRKFLWTDESDRQLIIQYAIYRVSRGAEYFRADWTSMSDLPADPSACQKRMASLNKIELVRSAVMTLCNILADKYTSYLGRDPKAGRQNNWHVEGTNPSLVYPESTHALNLYAQNWVDFDEPKIKMAIEEVLRYKKMFKSGMSKRNGYQYGKKGPDNPLLYGEIPSVPSFVQPRKQNSLSSMSTDGENGNLVEAHDEDFNMGSTGGQNSSCSDDNPRMMLGPSSGRGVSITTTVRKSLPVASAVELLKLVFLSNSASKEVQTLLAETLRKYTESELYAAFNYLRTKDFMVPGHGSRPFVLSSKFLSDASTSPFPIDSRKRVKKFSSWLCEQGQDLQLDGDCNFDLQCGETFHIFALISSGELNLSICLPDEGIGEVDEMINLRQKGKVNNTDRVQKDNLGKKESDYCIRREKGFPGIQLVLNPLMHLASGHSDKNNQQSELNDKKEEDNHQNCSILTDSDAWRAEGSRNLSSSSEISESDSLWHDMTSYAKNFSLMFVCGNPEILSIPSLFKSLFISIKQAGEEGLKMEEISQTMIVDDQLTEIFVDTLEVFQLVLKVNAYDGFRIVDSSHKSKYFITMFADNKHPFQSKSHARNYNVHEIPDLEKNQGGYLHTENVAHVKLPAGHKVTLLALPEDPKLSQLETCCLNKADALLKGLEITCLPDEIDHCICRPILPWINGDGSNNSIMYRGLVRRVLGIVTQNPGILEDDVVSAMDVLNPQSCRQLLELMFLDNHIMVKRILQTTSCAPPTMLQGLVKSNVIKSKSIFRKHLFANAMSTEHL